MTMGRRDRQLWIVKKKRGESALGMEIWIEKCATRRAECESPNLNPFSFYICKIIINTIVKRALDMCKYACVWVGMPFSYVYIIEWEKCEILIVIIA